MRAHVVRSVIGTVLMRLPGGGHSDDGFDVDGDVDDGDDSDARIPRVTSGRGYNGGHGRVHWVVGTTANSAACTWRQEVDGGDQQ